MGKTRLTPEDCSRIAEQLETLAAHVRNGDVLTVLFWWAVKSGEGRTVHTRGMASAFDALTAVKGFVDKAPPHACSDPGCHIAEALEIIDDACELVGLGIEDGRQVELH